ncbi:pancreatic progenitor cell differentiation and proliferation factor [Thomomys bottae]
MTVDMRRCVQLAQHQQAQWPRAARFRPAWAGAPGGERPPGPPRLVIPSRTLLTSPTRALVLDAAAPPAGVTSRGPGAERGAEPGLRGRRAPLPGRAPSLTDWLEPPEPGPRRSTAAIPSSGSLVATHGYYRRRLGSASSSSSSGSADLPGEAAPHPPVPGWQGSWSGRQGRAPQPHGPPTPPFRRPPAPAASGAAPRGPVPEALRKQPGSQPGQAHAGPRC